MDDIFYFTNRPVNLEDVAVLARAAGWNHVVVTHRGLEMRYDDEPNSRCAWAPFELDDAGPAEAAELRAEGITCGFCISHHRQSQWLLKLLEEVLLKFGGWLGNDSDGFLPKFDASNVGRLWHVHG